MYKYVSGNTTFERYNKKYITPEAFNAYKIHPVAVLCGFASAALVYYMMDEYAVFLMSDIVLACYFICMSLIIKSLYTCGFLNSTAATNTASYYVSNFYAILAQVSFWRVLISTPLTISIYGSNVFIHNNMFWIVMLGLNLLAFFVFKGLFAREKYYNRTAQKVYSAVLDGPAACGESCTEFIANNAVTTAKLAHVENANSEYFEVQNDFFDSARQIKQIVANYDEDWRMALIGANYCYSKEIPINTPMFMRLKSAMNEHRENAENLNAVITELNKKPYVDPPRKPTYIYVEAPTKNYNNNNYANNESSGDNKMDDKKHNSGDSIWDSYVDNESSGETKRDDKKYNPANSIWDNNVNWY